MPIPNVEIIGFQEINLRVPKEHMDGYVHNLGLFLVKNSLESAGVVETHPVPEFPYDESLTTPILDIRTGNIVPTATLHNFYDFAIPRGWAKVAVTTLEGRIKSNTPHRTVEGREMFVRGYVLNQAPTKKGLKSGGGMVAAEVPTIVEMINARPRHHLRHASDRFLELLNEFADALTNPEESK